MSTEPVLPVVVTVTFSDIVTPPDPTNYQSIPSYTMTAEAQLPHPPHFKVQCLNHRISVWSPEGTPVQFNFRLDPSATNLALLGIAFAPSNVPQLALNAGGPDIGASEFPAIVVTRACETEGTIALDHGTIAHSVPPHTLAVIDANLASRLRCPYTFIVLVQYTNDAGGSPLVGIIDPVIENEPEL